MVFFYVVFGDLLHIEPITNVVNHFWVIRGSKFMFLGWIYAEIVTVFLKPKTARLSVLQACS